jgi:hypothetical protein
MVPFYCAGGPATKICTRLAQCGTSLVENCFARTNRSPDHHHAASKRRTTRSFSHQVLCPFPTTRKEQHAMGQTVLMRA